MGWLILLVLVAITGAGLWWFGKLPRATLELAGAALLLGVAGYAWQGNPAQKGSPVSSPDAMADPDEDEALIKSLGTMNTEAMWLDQSQALMRAGRTRLAVKLIDDGLKKSPKNPDLWVGLGYALFVHNGGQMSPASQFAFEKGAQIAPNHPGPPFYMGLAMARMGKVDEAGEIWRGLLARIPAEDSEMRADIEGRLAQIGQMPTTPPPAK